MKQIIKNIALLAFLALISNACGPIEIKDSEHTLQGDPTLTIDWGFDQFQEVFRDECQDLYDKGEIDDVDQCIADKIVELIKLIEAGYNQDQVNNQPRN